MVLLRITQESFLKNRKILVRTFRKVVWLCRHQQCRCASNCSVAEKCRSKLGVEAGLDYCWQSSCERWDFVQAVYVPSQTVHNYVRNVNAVTVLSDLT